MVRGGRTFLRNLIESRSSTTTFDCHHLQNLTFDGGLWDYLSFMGTPLSLVDLPLPAHVFATDACLVGGAGHFNGDWFFTSWADDSPSLANSNINVLLSSWVCHRYKSNYGGIGPRRPMSVMFSFRRELLMPWCVPCPQGSLVCECIVHVDLCLI